MNQIPSDKLHRARGFTLLELVVSIAILAVMVGIAAPSMQTLVSGNRVEAVAQSMYSSLMSARSEAVARNQSVFICKSADGTNCVTSNYWEQGWLVFVDENSNGSKDTGETIISVVSALDSGYTLRTGTPYADKLQYRPDGTVNDSDTFRLCPPSNDPADGISLILNITGRPRGAEGSGTCP